MSERIDLVMPLPWWWQGGSANESSLLVRWREDFGMPLTEPMPCWYLGRHDDFVVPRIQVDSEADQMLLMQCWCGRHVALVHRRLIRRGATFSCSLSCRADFEVYGVRDFELGRGRGRPRTRPNRDEEIVVMWKQGERVPAIAKFLDYSPLYVYRLVRDLKKAGRITEFDGIEVDSPALTPPQNHAIISSIPKNADISAPPRKGRNMPVQDIDDLLDSIGGGEYDMALDAIIEGVKHRQSNMRRRQLRRFEEGDRVKMTGDVQPRHLRGQRGTVQGERGTKLKVLFDMDKDEPDAKAIVVDPIYAKKLKPKPVVQEDDLEVEEV